MTRESQGCSTPGGIALVVWGKSRERVASGSTESKFDYLGGLCFDGERDMSLPMQISAAYLGSPSIWAFARSCRLERRREFRCCAGEPKSICRPPVPKLEPAKTVLGDVSGRQLVVVSPALIYPDPNLHFQRNEKTIDDDHDGSLNISIFAGPSFGLAKPAISALTVREHSNANSPRRRAHYYFNFHS